MNCNDKGLAIIKAFEGLRLNSYQDIGAVWTIGYGHTRYVMPGQTITEDQAELLLLGDVKEVCQRLDLLLKNIPLTENQYSALVALVFNIGIGNFTGSTLLRYLRFGKMDLAAGEFLCWDHDKGKVIAGLQRRRQSERALF